MSETPTADPERVARTFQVRFERADYTAIFMHGFCYHFALAIHDVYDYPLEYVPPDAEAFEAKNAGGPPAIGHCWAVKPSGQAIDVNGVHRRAVILELYNSKCLHEPSPIEPEVLQASLAVRSYPPEVNQRAFDLAHRILMEHERFEQARPASAVAIALFSREGGP
jgi:hypothetical protein